MINNRPDNVAQAVSNDTASDAASKAAALVGNHSYLATLLAVLCLVFAFNYFLTGPGSDGGSGLGGTGKFGGESGLGGTGKAPDTGPGFKFGAADSEDDTEAAYSDYLTPEYSAMDALHAELGIDDKLLAGVTEAPKPDFDVNALRLSPDQLPAAPAGVPADQVTVDTLVAGIDLDTPATDMNALIDRQRETIAAATLVASLEVLNGLILAEAEASLQVAGTDATTASDATIRHRVTVPVRPERPDRFTVPSRIRPVQRVDIPAPPPVRPMRTLSTLLNR